MGDLDPYDVVVNPQLASRWNSRDADPDVRRLVRSVRFRTVPLPDTGLHLPGDRSPDDDPPANGGGADLPGHAQPRTPRHVPRGHPRSLRLGDPLDPPLHAKLLPDPPRGGRGGRPCGRRLRLQDILQDRAPDGPPRPRGGGRPPVHVGLERLLLRTDPLAFPGQLVGDAASAQDRRSEPVPTGPGPPVRGLRPRDDRARPLVRRPPALLHPRNDRMDDQGVTSRTMSRRPAEAHAWRGFARVPRTGFADRTTIRSP